MTIKIFTKDEDTIIQANAVKDDGTAYNQTEISQIRILIIGPRNDGTIHPAVTAGFTTDNTFEGIIPGILPKEGYWGFQFECTLVSSGKPVCSKIFYQYVGYTITSSA